MSAFCRPPRGDLMLEQLARARAAQAMGSRFSVLLTHLQPTPTKLNAYAGHRRTLEARLQQFATPAVEVIGSHDRGTAIRDASDMDILVRIPREMAMRGGSMKSSATVLQNIRVALKRLKRSPVDLALCDLDAPLLLGFLDHL